MKADAKQFRSRVFLKMATFGSGAAARKTEFA